MFQYGTETGARQGCIASSRFTAISHEASSSSMPMHGNPNSAAATRVLPLPINGSRMMPPGGVMRRIKYFIKEVEGKPAELKEKILQGKLDAYFGEMVLLNQPFIKNPEITIQGLIDAASQKFGEKMSVTRFNRFKVLEG